MVSRAELLMGTNNIYVLLREYILRIRHHKYIQLTCELSDFEKRNIIYILFQDDL